MTLVEDYRGMAKWFVAHYNQEVRFNSAVKLDFHLNKAMVTHKQDNPFLSSLWFRSNIFYHLAFLDSRRLYSKENMFLGQLGAGEKVGSRSAFV